MHDPLELQTSWRDHLNVVREIKMWVIVVVVTAIALVSLTADWITQKRRQENVDI